MVKLTNGEILFLIKKLSKYVIHKNVFFIPTSGFKIAELLYNQGYKFKTIYNIKDADIIIDDIIDTGKTIDNYLEQGCKVKVLITKNLKYKKYAIKYIKTNDWISLFNNDFNIEDNIVRILEYIGENPLREGLRDTPKRVVKMYDEIFYALKNEPPEIKVFLNEENYDQMVIEKDLEFNSICEHHLVPFFGKVHVGYIPDKYYIGLSKIGRVVDYFSKKPQVQERLTTEIAEFLYYKLKPVGLMVVIEAQHLCQAFRGVKKPRHNTITSKIIGSFDKNEFLSFIKSSNKQ